MEKNSRQVSVILMEQDYIRLIQLARESNRTVSGYFRWLLHQHFMELDHGENSGRADRTGFQV